MNATAPAIPRRSCRSAAPCVVIGDASEDVQCRGVRHAGDIPTRRVRGQCDGAQTERGVDRVEDLVELGN
jgi:hypothetical protein